jgi:hypothetical protein
MTDILNMKKGSSELADLVDGAAAITALATGEGKIYYLNPSHTNASDTNTGNRNSKDTPFATLAGAYAGLTANQNDVLVYVAGSTSLTLSAAFTWAKSYTHFIGVCAPTRTAQRARIFQLSTLTGASPLFTVSASGCVFSNFYIFQGVDDATSLINVSVTGGRNYFENVHFAGGGHATQAINGGASLHLNAAEENTFVNCTVGVDTIDAATGMVGILFDGEAHRNEFYNCKVRIRAGNAGAAFMEIVDATGIDRDTIFQDCLFLNNSATALTSAFVAPAGMGAPRKVLFKDCMVLGSTKLDANDRDVFFGNMNAVTGADLSGVAVELVT